MHSRNVYLILPALFAISTTLRAQTLDAIYRGWYDENGVHNPNNTNYIAGDCRGPICQGNVGDLRNFFVFDLSGVTEAITDAVLMLEVPSAPPGFASSDLSETYELHSVETPIDILVGGVGGLATHADLGSGTVFGTHLATAADRGTFVSIPLNGAALADLNAAAGGNWAIGGSITTLDAVANDEYLFGYTLEEGTALVLVTGAPCFALDFETDDTGAGMAHGTRVDTEFDGGATFPVTITSSSNTAAILNSSTGPAVQDPDLLIGTGDILILQNDSNLNECPPLSGIYCSHNDDEDGGTLSFAFPVPVTPGTIDLIDIDSTDPGTSVVLTDLNGNTRTYTVPTGWTEDITVDGPPGFRSLDLVVDDPQPGFNSSATETHDVGYEELAVVRIDVNLGGSGGVDNLSWCLPQAGVAIRNGSGQNPMNLTSISMPVIGGTWSADLDCRAYGSGVAMLVVRAVPLTGTPSAFGEILVGGPLLHRTIRHYSGSVSRLTWNVPSDLSLCGLVVHTQGLCRSSSGVVGPKTHRILGGLSNALDLTLGF